MGAVFACTFLLWWVRDVAHEAHMALAYLLVVLGGSARHGRVAGILLAVASFLSFNFFLLPPLYTLAIEDPLDWWVLAAFLITGMVAAELFHRNQEALETSRARAREVERLSALGAESLSVPRASDAVAAIARVIRSELPVESVDLWMFDEGGEITRHIASGAEDSTLVPLSAEIAEAVRRGRAVVSGPRGLTEVDVAQAADDSDLSDLFRRGQVGGALHLPLRVRDRPLGVLRLADSRGLHLDPARARFADTLRYYAALAVERVRLSVRAERVEALQEADRLKDALLASVSHDLRTPLTTIRALAAEMRDWGDERSVVIEEEAERLNRFVTDLLDLSRARAGALPLHVELNAAEDLVGSMLQRVAGVADPGRIEVDLPVDGAILLGRFDFVHALRALGNLVENALRHSPEHAPVGLAVREEGDQLVFTVSDRGPGVPADDVERIFEPFSQLHGGNNDSGAPRRPTENTGTGLGLAIARRVAEAQGGTVGYRPREGGGSVFELRLPAGGLDRPL